MEQFTLFFISYSALLLAAAAAFIFITIRRAVLLMRAIHHHHRIAEAERQRKVPQQPSAGPSHAPGNPHLQQMKDIVAHENVLRGERLLYNRSVAQYNELLASAITGLILRCFGFEPASLYDLE